MSNIAAWRVPSPLRPRWTEQLFQEFVDAIKTARDEDEFERIASRTAHGLGFRWFAYLSMADGPPQLISSYPKSWTCRYFRLKYQGLDPVVLRARAEHDVFAWGPGEQMPGVTKRERSFFEEATRFGIKSGITVPIRGGFGQMAAFTLATDDPLMQPEQLLAGSRDVVHLIGLYFHAHLSRRAIATDAVPDDDAGLSQRERQCLTWVACGKTIAEAAVLMRIAPRTAAFYLENARRKLGTTTTAHSVAQAIRRRLLP
jgi:LuxR family transcriptional activator of conjugal transfer of Ti plasmids